MYVALAFTYLYFQTEKKLIRSSNSSNSISARADRLRRTFLSEIVVHCVIDIQNDQIKFERCTEYGKSKYVPLIDKYKLQKRKLQLDGFMLWHR